MTEAKYKKLIKESEEKLASARAAQDKTKAEKILGRMAFYILCVLYENKSNDAKEELLEELGDMIDAKSSL